MQTKKIQVDISNNVMEKIIFSLISRSLLHGKRPWLINKMEVVVDLEPDKVKPKRILISPVSPKAKDIMKSLIEFNKDRKPIIVIMVYTTKIGYTGVTSVIMDEEHRQLLDVVAAKVITGTILPTSLLSDQPIAKRNMNAYATLKNYLKEARDKGLAIFTHPNLKKETH